jgi:ADP-ribose pyrophosphatase YjhB (NUDIX family)
VRGHRDPRWRVPIATRREVAEELGLDITVGRLLGIDSVPEGLDYAPMLAFSLAARSPAPTL